ncbi:MAG TPA: hypothetical protein VGE45_19120 [Chloroflexia bacterium]|jgi:hypothetical protein
MLNSSGITARWRDLLNKVPPTPLIAFLLVSLPLTGIAIFYLPYPDAAPWIFGWLVALSLIFLLLVLQRDSRSLGIERYLSGVLTFAFYMAAVSALEIGPVVFKYFSSPSLTLLITELLASFICLATFALLRGRMNAALYRRLSNPLAIAAQIVILLAFLGVVIVLLPDK